MFATLSPIMEMKDISEIKAENSDSERPKRKRQRLDHLSQEEKLMRRKLKNRMAAQSARDRKKVKMLDLEEEVIILSKERKALLNQNQALRLKNTALEKENKELLRRLGLICEKRFIDVEEVSDGCDWSEPLESAEGTGDTCIAHIAQSDSTAIDDALRLLVSDKESDALLDVLHMYSEELLDSADVDSKEPEMESITNIKCEQMSIVDSTTSQLESIKDLISFEDHLYHKIRSTDSPFNYNINSINSIDNNNISNPLSPLSCNSDSGYESVPSPTLSFDEEIIETSNVNLDDSITELFPDLV